MHDSLLVQILQRPEKLSDYYGRVPLNVMPLLDDAIEELSSLEQLQHEVDVELSLVDFIEFDDVRMVEVPHDVDLVDQSHLNFKVNSSPKEEI